MKGFKGNVTFGIVSISALVISGLVMLTQENPQTFFLAIVFCFAFAGGIAIWVRLWFKESKKRKAENLRRKKK